jgi:quinohemoprotein ethanol dehydrogenase
MDGHGRLFYPRASTARSAIPDGYTFEGDATLKAPLSELLITASSATVEPGGRAVAIQLNKAEIDNNMPMGDAVPLVVAAHFRQNGAQKQLTSSVSVRVVK